MMMKAQLPTIFVCYSHLPHYIASYDNALNMGGFLFANAVLVVNEAKMQDNVVDSQGLMLAESAEKYQLT
jgi:hypothetical protein